jgi:hypothetical protein
MTVSAVAASMASKGDTMSQLEKWTHLARHWQHQGPPATPSVQDIDNFSAFVAKYVTRPDPTIAVLGSTPALRIRIAADWPDSSIIVVDFCREMYHATSAAVPPHVIDRELYLASDWLLMNMHLMQQIDVFVGDKSLDNVAKPDWAALFRSIRTCMKETGLLVLHIGLPDPDMAGQTFEQLADKWIGEPFETEEVLTIAAAGLWEDMLSGSATPRNDYLSIEPYRPNLEESSRSDGPLGRLSRRVLDEFAGEMNAQWTNFTESDVKSTAAEIGLMHMETLHSGDYYAARCQPILAFRASNF